VKSQTVSLKDCVGRMIRTEARVGFTDCDPYGHMASARYLEMAINHRMSAVTEQLGFDTLQTARETGVGFVNKEVNLKFKAPAKFDDRLIIESWIDEVQDYQLKVKIRISHRETEKVMCRVTVTTVTFDARDGIPVPVPLNYNQIKQVDILSLPWAPGHPSKTAQA